MVLIKLEGLYGPIWVNPNYISSISFDTVGSIVFMDNDSNGISVKEKPEEILHLIQSSLQ